MNDQRTIPFTRCWTQSALWVLCLVGSASAQDVLIQAREDLRSETRESYGAFLVGLGDLGREAELTGGTLYVADNDLELSLSTLPIPVEFPFPEGGGRLRLETVLGYTRAAVNFSTRTAAGLSRARAKYHSATVDFGVGPSFDLPGGWRVAPLIHCGLSYVTNSASYHGEAARLLEQLASGIIFDFEELFGTLGGSLALRHEGVPLGPVTLSWALRYDLRRSEPLIESGDTSVPGILSHWVTASLSWQGPLRSAETWRTEWQIDLSYRRYFGTLTDALGFHDYVALSGTLVIALPWGPFSDLRPNVGGIVGEDVLGWSAGVGASF